MRDRALQGQRRCQLVRMRGESCRLLGRHEAEVIIAMRHLRLPARVHDVDLRRHLILGSEPCSADQGQHVVGVVISEDSRVVDRQLVQCAPDSIVLRPAWRSDPRTARPRPSAPRSRPRMPRSRGPRPRGQTLAGRLRCLVRLSSACASSAWISRRVSWLTKGAESSCHR